MAKEIKCPWCGEVVVEPTLTHKQNDHSTIIERRCVKCGNVIAAYSENEGMFLQKIRTFKE